MTSRQIQALKCDAAALHIQQILSNELVILTYSPGMHKAMNEVKVRNSPVRNGCGQESVSERSFT